MTKTNDELQVLKKEIDELNEKIKTNKEESFNDYSVLSIKLKELSEEELKIVAGGSFYTNPHFVGRVGKYEVKHGETYYISWNRNPKVFCSGKLVKSNKDDVLWGIFSKRKYIFESLFDWSNFLDYTEIYHRLSDGTYEIPANDVTLYENIY